MRHVSPAWITIAALTLMAPAVHAIPMTFTATLLGANELPDPVSSPGTGFATIVLDPTAQTLQINATFSGLTSNVVAAHIHCCAPFGTNAGVATTLPVFPGFPMGVTNFVTDLGGLAQAEAALIAGISSEQSYFNIHTVNFGGGEIRGQLFVPEPHVFSLVGVALLALAGFARRRKLH
jgi:CHRD domain